MGYDGELDPKKMSVPVSILKKSYQMDASKVFWTLRYINEYETKKPERMKTEMDLIKLITSYYLQAKYFWSSCEELDQTSSQEKIDKFLDVPAEHIIIDRSELEKERLIDESKRAIKEHREIPEDYDGDIDDIDFSRFIIADKEFDEELLKQRKRVWENQKESEDENSFSFADDLPEDLSEDELLLYEKGEADLW